MLVQVIADYGAGDLAFAEVRQRLALHLPGADVGYTPVEPFDTLGAGFCTAQLALTEGPAERIVYSNVAPREDTDEPRPENEGERLVATRLPGGVLVVGVNSTYAFSFLREEVDDLHEVAIPQTGSQFRSRDAFPALLPRLWAGEGGLLARRLAPHSVPAVPEGVVAYIDGYGNLKTTWSSPPASPGTEVEVRIGKGTARAVVGDGTFAVPAGELSFAAGSSGWQRRDGSRRDWYELLVRGGSAAALFGWPEPGAAVQVQS